MIMPGDNCAVVGCGSCRRAKGIGIWKLPAPRNDAYKKWRDDWLNELKKWRVVDEGFQKLIDADRVYTCEKHFALEDIEIYQTEKMTKKKPIFGALPTLNMPRKGHNIKRSVPGQPRSIVKAYNEDTKKRCVYIKDFEEFCKRIQSLKCLDKWNVNLLDDRLELQKLKESLLLPELEVVIDDSLGFTIKVYGFYLQDDHELYLKNFRSVINTPVSDLIKDLEDYVICCGVNPVIAADVVHHVIPKAVDHLTQEGTIMHSFPHKEYWRVKDCEILCNGQEQCFSCSKYLQAVDKTTKTKKVKKKNKFKEPAHIQCEQILLLPPVFQTHPEKELGYSTVFRLFHRLKKENTQQ